MTRGRVRLFVGYEDLGRVLGLPAGLEVQRTHEPRDGVSLEVTVVGEGLPVPERGNFPTIARLNGGELTWSGGAFPAAPAPHDVVTPEPQSASPLGLVGEVVG